MNTYDKNLPTDVDWVRRLIGDVNMASAMLSDEEIQATLDSKSEGSPARRYTAAADLLEMLHVTWMSAGKGKASKKVAQLQIVYGTGSGINIDLAIQTHISSLRKRGAFLASPRPRPFRCL